MGALFDSQVPSRPPGESVFGSHFSDWVIGRGPGAARFMTEWVIGNPNVHSSIASLVFDYGLLRVFSLVAILVFLYFPVNFATGKARFDLDQFWRFFSLLSFGALSLFSEPLEGLPTVLCLCVILIWQGGSTEDRWVAGGGSKEMNKSNVGRE